jgi:hypothetical protein
MLIANEDPFEKSTPQAWRTALPAKLSRPDGSLIRRSKMRRIVKKTVKTYTILLKFAKGVSNLEGKRRPASANEGLPAPRPAFAAPMAASGFISDNLKPGLLRLPEGGGAVPRPREAVCGGNELGWWTRGRCTSSKYVRCKACAAESAEKEAALCEAGDPRLSIWGRRMKKGEGEAQGDARLSSLPGERVEWEHCLPCLCLRGDR